MRIITLICIASFFGACSEGDSGSPMAMGAFPGGLAEESVESQERFGETIEGATENAAGRSMAGGSDMPDMGGKPSTAMMTEQGGGGFDGNADPIDAVGGHVDLLLVEARTRDEIWLDEKVFSASSCAVQEGCIDTPGRRTLLRFSVVTANVGERDLYFGRPADYEDLFYYSRCHEHFHFDKYATYELQSNDGLVARGHKQAFCLMDTSRYDEDDPTVREEAQYNCRNQGISRGWQDVYGGHLDCQWIDVTDVDPGEYELSVSIDPERRFNEIDYSNNTIEVPVMLPPLNINRPCRDGEINGPRRSCEWNARGVGSCRPGELVEIGCGGCGDLGSPCRGQPMIRVCDGDGTQCLPSMAIAASESGCGDNGCPHVEFMCPESSAFSIWTAGQDQTEGHACDFSIRTGPPRVDRPCLPGARAGLQRDCGWRFEGPKVECEPGFYYAVGCNPEGEGCGLGTDCRGDPMIRICEGDLPCSTVSALTENDDSCRTVCPQLTVECPLRGAFSVLTNSYRVEDDYTCDVDVVRVAD